MKISVCIIGKNEERVLNDCLAALSVYEGEIVFTDTGSTDSTKDIAARYTDKIYDFEWIGDFSAARNYCAGKASNDWILCIDCDEIIESFDFEEVVRRFADNPYQIGTICQKNILKTEDDSAAYDECHQTRFYHRKYFAYKYSIHEQLRPLEGDDMLPAVSTGISVVHSGYCEGGEEKLIEKRKRSIGMLEREIEKCQDAYAIPYFYFEMGLAYNGYDNAKAMECFKKSMDIVGLNKTSYLDNLVTYNGYLVLEHHSAQAALYATWPYKDLLADYADFNYLVAVIFVELKGYQQAKDFLLRAINSTKYSDIRTKTTLAHHYLDVLERLLATTIEV